MRKKYPLVRRILFAVIGAVLLVTFGSLALRYLIERAITPEAVVEALTAAMGRKVAAERVGVSSIYGIVLEDVTMREYDADSTLIMEAGRIRLAPRWRSLLAGRFEISTVRILDATLQLRRDSADRGPGGWNLARLFFELRADTTPSTVSPVILAERLRLIRHTAETPRVLFFESLRYRPSDDETRFRISEAEGRSCTMDGVIEPATDRIEVSFRGVESAMIPEIGTAAVFAGLNGRIEIKGVFAAAAGETGSPSPIEPLRIEGQLDGSDFTIAVGAPTVIRFGDFDLRRFAVELAPAALAWKAEIADLRLGRPNASLARLTANAEGDGGRLRRGRIEWDGPIERILALLPRDLIPEITTWQPRGGSAGHVLLGSAPARGAPARGAPARGAPARGGSPRITDLSVNFRGMTVRTPKQEAGSGLPSEETLTLHRGRFGITDAVISIDTVALTWGEDPFTITARIAQGAASGETGWICRIASAGFDVARLAPWIDPGLEASGRVGAELLIAPKRTSGRIALIGTTIRQAGLGTAVFNGGAIEFTPEGRFTLKHLATASGATIDGDVGAAPTSGAARPIALRIQLAGFDLASIREALDAATREKGLTLLGGAADGTIEVSGSTARRAMRGAVTVKNGAAEYNGHHLASIEGAIRFDSETLATPGLSARLGEGAIRVAGTYAPSQWKMTLALSGLNAALLNPFVAEVHEGLTMKGPIDATLALASAIEAPRTGAPGMAQERPTPRPSVTGTITFRGVEVKLRADLSFLGTVGSIEFQPDRIIARNIMAGYLGGVARFNGTIPTTAAGSYQLDVALDRGRIEHFQDALPESIAGSGPFEAFAMTVKGTRNDPHLGGSIRLVGARIKSPLMNEEILDARGELRFAPDSFQTPGLAFRIGTVPVRMKGGIERFDNPVFRALTISAEKMRLSDLLDLIPEKSRPLPRGARVSGLATLDNFQIDGPADRARWNGTITLTNGGADLPGLKRGLSSVNGALVFDGAKATMTSVAGRVGTSEARIEGSIGLAPPYALDLRLAIQDADITDLFAAIPRPPSLTTMDVGGKGTITAHLVQSGQDLRIDGGLSDGTTHGFGMPFENVSGDFVYDGRAEILSMTNLEGDWARGRTSSGVFKLRMAESPPTFDAAGEIHGASLPEILRMAAINPAGYAGQVDGHLAMTGRFGEANSLNGEGWLKIDRARFENLKPLDALSRTLRLDFFTRGTYESARGTFLIEKGIVRTAEPDHFRFNGANFGLEARGYAALEGECAFNYVCGMSGGLVGNLLTSLQIGRLFSLSGEGGVVRTAGTIRGRIDNPVVVTDLGILNVFGR